MSEAALLALRQLARREVLLVARQGCSKAGWLRQMQPILGSEKEIIERFLDAFRCADPTLQQRCRARLFDRGRIDGSEPAGLGHSDARAPESTRFEHSTRQLA